MNLTEITSGAPTEPFDLAAAKAHLVVHTTLDDDLITAQITAARAIAETYTGRAIATHAYRLVLDGFPARCIEIPKRDLNAVTLLDYIDRAGESQSLTDTDYVVRKPNAQCTCIEPAYDTDWPDTEPGFDKVTLEFTAGFAAIPDDLIAAIKLILGELYLHREDSIDGTINSAVPITSREIMRAYKLVSI